VSDTDVVYDLGCGDGRLAIGAAKRGARAVGIDIDPQRIREARDNAEREGVQRLATFRRADIFTLDLRPASVILFYPGVSLEKCG
jgi:ribosomal protein L11 methylase PrmA